VKVKEAMHTTVAVSKQDSQKLKYSFCIIVQYIQRYLVIYLKLREGKYAKPKMGTVRLRILWWEKESIKKSERLEEAGRFDQEEGNERD
jgi:hypothetical protein